MKNILTILLFAGLAHLPFQVSAQEKSEAMNVLYSAIVTAKVERIYDQLKQHKSMSRIQPNLAIFPANGDYCNQGTFGPWQAVIKMPTKTDYPNNPDSVAAHCGRAVFLFKKDRSFNSYKLIIEWVYTITDDSAFVVVTEAVKGSSNAHWEITRSGGDEFLAPCMDYLDLLDSLSLPGILPTSNGY